MMLSSLNLALTRPRQGPGGPPPTYLLAYNDTMVLLGDSNAEQSHQAGTIAGTLAQNLMRNEVGIFQALYPVFNTDVQVLTTGVTPWFDAANQGVSGQTTGQIFARVPHVIAMAPKAVKLMEGYNNRTTAMAAAGQPSGSEGIPDTYDALRAGLPTAVIIIDTVTATDGAAVTLNNAIRSYVATKRAGGDLRVFVNEKSRAVGTTTQANGAGTWVHVPTITNDTTHIGPYGGFMSALGEDGLGTNPDSYVSMLTSNNIIDIHGGSQYEDLWLLNGTTTNNYVNDPLFTGATSAAGGTGWTGIRPNAYSVVRGGTTPGVTMVSSIEADPENPGGNRWKMVFTAVNPGGGVGGAGGTGSNFETWQLQGAKAAPGIASTWFRGGVKISMPDSKNWLKLPSTVWRDVANAGRTSAALAYSNNQEGQRVIAAPFVITPMSMPQTGSATPGNLTMTITLVMASLFAPDGDTATIYISRPCAKAIPNPLPAFNL